MLRVLAERQVPVPEHIDIFHLAGYSSLLPVNCFAPLCCLCVRVININVISEVEASEESALNAVLSVADPEIKRLEEEAEEVCHAPHVLLLRRFSTFLVARRQPDGRY